VRRAPRGSWPSWCASSIRAWSAGPDRAAPVCAAGAGDHASELGKVRGFVGAARAGAAGRERPGEWANDGNHDIDDAPSTPSDAPARCEASQNTGATRRIAWRGAGGRAIYATAHNALAAEEDLAETSSSRSELDSPRVAAAQFGLRRDLRAKSPLRRALALESTRGPIQAKRKRAPVRP
jgi:hypothetical protein